MSKPLTAVQIELNKRIMAFMGLKPNMGGPDQYYYSDSPFFYCAESTPEKVVDAMAKYVKYHSSWEWLMPVVHKCLAVCHEAMLNEWEDSFADKFLSCSRKQMLKEIDGFLTFVSADAEIKKIIHERVNTKVLTED